MPNKLPICLHDWSVTKAIPYAYISIEKYVKGCRFMLGLINEANFFVVFIALLIISFMLGLIFGKVFCYKDKSESDHKKKDKLKSSSDNAQAAYPHEQDCDQAIYTSQGQKQNSNCPGYRYYNW